MRTLVRAGVLILSLTACDTVISQNSRVPVGEVLVFVESNWIVAPLEVGYEEESAYATLLLLEDSGRLLMIDCLLRRRPGGFTAISPGDGQNLYLGDWRLNTLTSIDMTYRLLSRSVARIPPETLPGPVINMRGKLLTDGLDVAGKRFTVSTEIPRKMVESYFSSSLN